MSVTDDFNRADGALGANWTATLASAAPIIVSNTVAGGAISAYNAAHYIGTTFNNDQTAQVTRVNGSNYFGPGVRHSAGSGGNFYGYFDHGATALQKYVSGSLTSIGDADVAGAGDVMKITVTGTSITTYLNGTPYAGGSVTDTSLTSGSPGVVAFHTNGTADNWVATGEVVAGIPGKAYFARQAVNRAATY